MKIIEGLKKIKDLQRKAEDLRSKIGQNCADLDAETPSYGTVDAQTKQIASWLQAHSDIIHEVESLRLRIQKTNLAVEVEVEVADGNTVKKPLRLGFTDARIWRNSNRVHGQYFPIVD